MTKEEFIERLCALDYERDAKLDAGVRPEIVFEQYKIACALAGHEYLKTLEASHVVR